MRVDSRLFGGDTAIVDQALNERVVGAQLSESAFAEPVGARIADVGEGEFGAVPKQGIQRRAHAFNGRVGLNQLSESLVRRKDLVSPYVAEAPDGPLVSPSPDFELGQSWFVERGPGPY